MTAEETAAIIRGLYGSFNLKDLDRLDAVAVMGATLELLPFDLRVELREAWRMWMRAFPDAQVEILQMDAQPDHADVELVARGTNRGPLALPDRLLRPTYRHVELRFYEHYEIDAEEGKISAGTSQFDAESAFEQLGIPPPAPPTPKQETGPAEFHWGY